MRWIQATAAKVCLAAFIVLFSPLEGQLEPELNLPSRASIVDDTESETFKDLAGRSDILGDSALTLTLKVCERF
jgi:hypothetical protein